MKKQFLLIAFLPLFTFAQSDKATCETLTRINNLLQEQHYRPKAVDDSLSVYVFKTFLEVLDEENRLFLEPEINELKKHQYTIDNSLLEKDCSFVNDFYLAYNKAINRYATIIESIKAEPFLFSSDEKVIFSKKSFPFLKNETELKHLYKKRALFDVLKDVAEISKNKDSIVTNFEKLAKLSKIKILDKYSCKSSELQFTRKEFEAKLFSSFCSYFDPHTDYFSENEKAAFLAGVSADNLTFGMYVSLTEKDEIAVDEIIPGSSAYFSKKIDIGDQIVKISINDDEYEIACSSMKKIEEIISSSDYKKADFTLRKKSGEIYSVSLIKKIMKDYENNLYSYIIEKDNKKSGYIRIPSFYGKFENGKTNVSDDLAKEIIKLQGDKIDGLIIDLENNGGGSMDEAINMAGLFIDIGPLAIMDNHEKQKETIRDPNRGTIYSGPIVILINGFSASASEFFTNAMQDYNRAIVVGNQSYGKASMQRIFPLTDDKNPSEFIKITLEKFYRITGKSNQTIGITPDIEIPLLFDKQMPRESANKTALKSDEIQSTLRYTVLTNELKSKSIENSKNRLKENETIKTIIDLNTKINTLYDTDLPPIVLQFSDVFVEVNKVNTLWSDIKSKSEIEFPISVERNKIDIEYQQFDEYLKSNNIEKIKAIKTNIHIIEAANIINDLIN